MTSARSALALLLVIVSTAGAGDRGRRVMRRPVYAPTAAVVEEPRFIASPNGLTAVPALGTFYPDPGVVTRSGSPGVVYSPAGNFSEAASLAVFGPLSRFSAVPAEATVFQRSYGGGLQPAGSLTVFTYPGLDPLRPSLDTHRLRDFGGPRPGFDASPNGGAPYLLGQY